ncbi:Membrane-anchored ubiquitin-fold protein 4 [Capsicum annuum]|nr:Membrane-anchored ubiquitin-fold protein 4 [Capsicum annuum]
MFGSGDTNVLQWLLALDLQVMGACRVGERLKPLLKINVSAGAAEDRLLAHLSQEDLVEVKFRLFDGSDVGPFRFSLASTVAMLKDRIVAELPKDATTMVVKRLKDVGAGKEEFEQQMEIVGSIKHKNVVELRAYYYSARVVLLQCSMLFAIPNYAAQTLQNAASLHDMLHFADERSELLTWNARVRVALGTARTIDFGITWVSSSSSYFENGIPD